jgi:hypothetical protein
VSYTAFEACLDPARRRCAASDLATLLALAAHVNQRDVEGGQPWRAWPSQAQLSHELGIGDRQVRRRLENLKRAGDVRDTGEFVGRGIRVYEITLQPRSEMSGVGGDGRADLTTLGEGDRTNTSTLDHMDRGGEGVRNDTGQDGPVARSISPVRPDDPDRDPGPYGPAEPEGNRKENRQENTEAACVSGLSPASTGTAGPTPAQLQAERAEDLAELAALEVQRETTRHREATERSISDLRERLGLDPLEVAA